MLFSGTSNKAKKYPRAARSKESFERYINKHVKKDLDQIIGPLVMGDSVHYANDTLFYLHDVIIYCLSQSGPAELFFSTYAIKEFQARLITKMRSENLITGLHALIDYRNEQLDAGAMQILNKSSDSFGYQRTHSKLAVIKNEKWGISIVTSSNLTNNTRLDVGVITCNHQIADARLNWITKHIKNDTYKKAK
jgi:hypothetical protein